MLLQKNKIALFTALHQKRETFMVPNAWDASSARLFENLGYKAIATSSAALAISNGLPDNSYPLEIAFENIREICDASILPVTADFGYGFAEDPDKLYLNTLELIKCGIAGLSIEDVKNDSVYPLEYAIERLKAVIAACNESGNPILTARSDNFFIGIHDLKDTRARLMAYQKAGADVLFAPGLQNIDQVHYILKAIEKPLNVMLRPDFIDLNIQVLATLGVSRLSFGASLLKISQHAIASYLQDIKTRLNP